MVLGAARPQAAGSFRPDIEGLRGVAILAVVGCHCGIAWCTGGFVGVDIFFVLSGYLITGLLASEYAATSRIDFPGFYARRARRLLPACILMLAATALFAVLFLSPQEMIITGRGRRASTSATCISIAVRRIISRRTCKPIRCCTRGHSGWRSSFIWFGLFCCSGPIEERAEFRV